MWFGSAGDLSDFLYVQLTTPKATIVANRKIVRGRHLIAGEIADWRYGQEPMAAALRRQGYSADVLSDFFLNLLLSYSPEKILLSRENVPQSVNIDLAEINRKLASRLQKSGGPGVPLTEVAMGRMDREDGARAAAALVFDDFFNTFTL
jgi:hypothetical protein